MVDQHGEQTQAAGTIGVERSRSMLRERYYFVARDAQEGRTVLKGGEFPGTAFGIRLGRDLPEGKTERRMLRNLIDELAVLGWQAVPTGESWYAHRIYYRGPEQVAMPDPVPEQREGLSTTAMWGWTMAIVLVLFAICVLLAFTSEVRFSPAT